MFTGEGDSCPAALRQLPAPAECIQHAARLAGDAYARRIAPSYVDLQRTYFTSARKDVLVK
ncbi:hypothetical protein E4631_01400 [Hymenobacter sp. UV11]|nr:hypothetical protein A8B98_03225 [Hymenobacter sp. UV11]TFZ68749.1 hypothetical protein E4631_01400 [Hymenobacter sp. UV11]